MKCDMHNHSIFSDGTFTPEKLVEIAKESNLSAIALTDHNTILGLDRFLNAPNKGNIELVGGIEFSTDYKGTELHILGLFIPKENYDEIEEKVQLDLKRKAQSNIDLVNNLIKEGFDLTYEEIVKTTPNGNINRAVIANYMMHKGYVESVSEAFEKYLNPSNGLYTPPEKLSATDTIEYINSIGAVSVLAHPFLNLKTEEKIREFLTLAKEKNLDGMEVYYSKFNEEQTEIADKLADEFHLIKSGGSDFHGENKPEIKMGTGKGNLNIPYSVYENLKNRFIEKNK